MATARLARIVELVELDPDAVALSLPASPCIPECPLLLIVAGSSSDILPFIFVIGTDISFDSCTFFPGASFSFDSDEVCRTPRPKRAD
jgi:hypothetical protein